MSCLKNIKFFKNISMILKCVLLNIFLIIDVINFEVFDFNVEKLLKNWCKIDIIRKKKISNELKFVPVKIFTNVLIYARFYFVINSNEITSIMLLISYDDCYVYNVFIDFWFINKKNITIADINCTWHSFLQYWIILNGRTIWKSITIKIWFDFEILIFVIIVFIAESFAMKSNEFGFRVIDKKKNRSKMFVERLTQRIEVKKICIEFVNRSIYLLTFFRAVADVFASFIKLNIDFIAQNA